MSPRRRFRYVVLRQLPVPTRISCHHQQIAIGRQHQQYASGSNDRGVLGQPTCGRPVHLAGRRIRTEQLATTPVSHPEHPTANQHGTAHVHRNLPVLPPRFGPQPTATRRHLQPLRRAVVTAHDHPATNHQRCDTVLVELSGKRLAPQDRAGRRIQPQVELLRLSHQVSLAGDGQKHR